LKISEIFYSLQGEGRSIGVPTIFVRFGCCNLVCNFCDSKYAFVGEEKTEEQVLQKIYSYLPCKKICFTGGEPLFQRDSLKALIERLLPLGYVIEIETNGSIAPPKSLIENNNIFWNVSPKLSNSGNDLKDSLVPEVLKSFNQASNTIFKFVIGSEEDFKEVKD